VTPDEEANLSAMLTFPGRTRAWRSLRGAQKFPDVFVRCQETGSPIDIGFVPLGLCLATLVEHLEALGEPFDARAASAAGATHGALDDGGPRARKRERRTSAG
jgi:hypothetical protein